VSAKRCALYVDPMLVEAAIDFLHYIDQAVNGTFSR